MAAILSKATPQTRDRDSKLDLLVDRYLIALQICSFALGIAAPLAGLVLAIFHSVFPAVAGVEIAASILCISTIPLLLFGSHLMDVIDRRRRSRREAMAAPEFNHYDNN